MQTDEVTKTRAERRREQKAEQRNGVSAEGTEEGAGGVGRSDRADAAKGKITLRRPGTVYQIDLTSGGEKIGIGIRMRVPDNALRARAIEAITYGDADELEPEEMRRRSGGEATVAANLMALEKARRLIGLMVESMPGAEFDDGEPIPWLVDDEGFLELETIESLGPLTDIAFNAVVDALSLKGIQAKK